MKSQFTVGMTFALAIFVLSGCQDAKKATGPAAPGAVCPVPAAGRGVAAAPGRIEGIVVQTLSAGRYVYVELNTGSGSVWIAAPEEPVAKGDKISCPSGMLMKNFDSPVLKRKFDEVYFVESLTAGGSTGSLPPGHPTPHGGDKPMMSAGHGESPASIKVEVAAAEGGVTIATVAEQREKLAGKEVLLRGKVTKYNAAIMEANWLHVRDASDKRDLVVTTKGTAKVGDTVLIKGVLERDVDLGAGYSYDLIIRNADVTVEQTAQP